MSQSETHIIKLKDIGVCMLVKINKNQDQQSQDHGQRIMKLFTKKVELDCLKRNGNGNGLAIS